MNPDQEWTNNRLSVEYLNGLHITTPTMMLDSEDIVEKYTSLAKNLPQAKIFYAVKCNPEPIVLETLAKLGSGFEIASDGELQRVSALVPAKDVIFSNTIKSSEDISSAYERSVNAYAFDSRSEVKRLAKSAPGARVFLRLSVSNSGSSIPLTKKFGVNESEAQELLVYARDKGLKVIGVSFHVGSQAENLHAWSEAIELASRVIQQAATAGFTMTVLDIGGGFPVRYTTIAPSIEEVCTEIQSALTAFNLSHMELWVEPGRYLVAEAGVICSTVRAIVKRDGIKWLYLDVGRFNCFTELFESEDIRYPILSSRDGSDETNTDQITAVLTGPTCDSFDTIYTDARVNKAIKEGDRLYFASAGAYTHVYGSAFNDFSVPGVSQ